MIMVYQVTWDTFEMSLVLFLYLGALLFKYYHAILNVLNLLILTPTKDSYSKC